MINIQSITGTAKLGRSTGTRHAAVNGWCNSAAFSERVTAITFSAVFKTEVGVSGTEASADLDAHSCVVVVHCTSKSADACGFANFGVSKQIPFWERLNGMAQ